MKYYDNTRLSDHMTCNRKFYLRHIRDWVPETSSKDLAFGEAWHKAMDVVWGHIELPDDKLTLGASMAFNKIWEKRGFPLLEDMTDEDYVRLGTKHPGIAYSMLSEYIYQRRDFIESGEVLTIEQPFAVPIDPNDPNLFYVGRLDKIFKKGGNIYGIEHKTTGLYKANSDIPFRQSYIESFTPNSQVDGYIHSGRMLYGEGFKGILVDAALCHKKIHDGFHFIPVERQIEHLDAWLWETHYKIEQLESDHRDLEVTRKTIQEVPYMAAFPKNTNACSHYNGCVYQNICRFTANPELEVEPPRGFKEEHWEPYDELKLDTIGLGPEKNGAPK